MGRRAVAGRFLVSGLTLAALAVVLLLSGVVPLPGGQRARLEFPPVPAGTFHAQPPNEPFYAEPFCHGCHPSPPHGRTQASRAILNHHATAVHCLVCHGRGLAAGAEESLGVKEGVLWPRVDGEWVNRPTEEAWRLKVTATSACFGSGPDCGSCHRPGGIVDYAGLGYEPERARRLSNLETFLLVPLRERWFFPGSF